MKTKRIIILSLLVFSFTLNYSQKMNYSAKTQKLIPEANFLPNADWGAIFYDASQSDTPSRVGVSKPVAIASDERIFISDRYNNTITILDKSGRVVKVFGKEGWNPGEFVNNQDLHGILDDKYLVISDAQGRINFFDLNGNFVKMITIDFMPLNIYPTKGGKMIIQGHVPFETKSKKLLAELDFETEKYEQIYYTFQDYDDPKGGISLPYEDGFISIGPPFSARKSMVRVSDQGRIIMGMNNSEEVNVFSKRGGTFQKSEFVLKTNPIAVTEKEKEEYYENFKEKLIKMGMDPALAEKVKADGYFPDHLPYYYNLIVDNANNCLFFMYSNENKDYVFLAYSIDGKFLGKSEFKIDGYDLLSNLGHFTFRDGYVYTLALKHNEDKPLRILKCKIVSE